MAERLPGGSEKKGINVIAAKKRNPSAGGVFAGSRYAPNVLLKTNGVSATAPHGYAPIANGSI